MRLLAECSTHKFLPAQPHICSDSEGMQSLVCLHLLLASCRPRVPSIMAQKHALAPCTCFCAFHSAVCCSSVLCVKIDHGLGPWAQVLCVWAARARLARILEPQRHTGMLFLRPPRVRVVPRAVHRASCCASCLVPRVSCLTFLLPGVFYCATSSSLLNDLP